MLQNHTLIDNDHSRMIVRASFGYSGTLLFSDVGDTFGPLSDVGHTFASRLLMSRLNSHFPSL